ncbi:MAG TPA: glutamine-hydrolyzing GMP synthase [Patescibacteria group bacterium]|nr:glutamine-hydrolyzing GMP synthase [Patescibacteria group bacterium]
MIYIIDFGGQTAQLIERRIKDAGIPTKFFPPEDALAEIEKQKPAGIILSGGPSSVYDKSAPTIDPKIFDLNIPILGICYGFQITAKLLGGSVVSGKKEYGPAKISITNKESLMAENLLDKSTVWMSHGDEIIKLPKGFEIIGNTENVPFAYVENSKQKIYGALFHPEVEHTEEGQKVLENFIRICELEGEKNEINTDQIIEDIKTIAGGDYVIGAISGGVDSTVAGTLTARAIGDHFIPVYVENGLMRDGTENHVLQIFKKFKIKPIIVHCEEEMLTRLRKIEDPEKKRKIIGNFYIEIFDREVEKLKENKNIKFLLQGTIYSDVIESKGTKHAAKIKSHHNVGGLPKDMKLKLLEPLRHFYKDEVRTIGRSLGLPEEFVEKQVFPGPGYAVRLRGEITRDRLSKIKIADNIVLEELQKAGLLKNIYMSFPIMTGASSVAVKGDGRFFGEVIALRIVESKDVMTATWSRLPYDVLQRISSRIVNEVPEISRVVYDISTKPPATMEWE